ncbi:MAG: hypothetical protein ABI808_10115, partial [Pseudonocardiales bacterium]
MFTTVTVPDRVNFIRVIIKISTLPPAPKSKKVLRPSTIEIVAGDPVKAATHPGIRGCLEEDRPPADRHVAGLCSRNSIGTLQTSKYGPSKCGPRGARTRNLRIKSPQL